MIFEDTHIDLNRITMVKCPITGVDAEPISSTREINEKWHKVEKSTGYALYQGVSGRYYSKKLDKQISYI